MKEQAVRINDQVLALTGKNGKPLRAGTTMVTVVADGGKLYWLSIGDSRIYIIRGEEMSQGKQGAQLPLDAPGIPEERAHHPGTV